MRMVSELSGEVGPSEEGCPLRILVVVMGKGAANISGAHFEFGPGSALLIGEDVDPVVETGRVSVGYLLGFDPGYVLYFLLQYPLARGLGLFGDLGMVRLGRGRLALVLSRVRTLGAEVERGAGFEHLKLLFSLFLLDVVGDRFTLAEPYDAGSHLQSEFRDLLEASFRETRRTVYYARRLGVSNRRLNVLCRGWFGGKGVFEVVMDRLISEAEFLLLGTDMPIKAIAYELGFSSGENFAMYFRRMRGISPLVFRLSGGNMES